MTEKEALSRVRTGNFSSKYGFDLQIMIDAIGTMGQMLKDGKICEVTRCKDCKEYKEWGNSKICMRLGNYHGDRSPDDYCSLAIHI